MSDIALKLKPNREHMLAHVTHVFDGFLDGCQDGLIELAWTDPNDGALKHAALFGTDELEDLVERATTINGAPGQNVYVGAALRKPDTTRDKRTSDDDFMALTTYYVDIDDDVLDKARAYYRDKQCPPTAVVVTGRHPHVRAQLLWRQETPERDPDVCRQLNLAIAQHLGGDPSVANPGRVLRLGGSIGWPKKPGREIELTEFATYDDGRPKVYFPGQVAKAFPPPSTPTTSDQPKPTSSKLNIGSEFDGVPVADCLAAVRADDHWHENMVRLSGHWVGRGWSDEEILTAAEALTLSGYTTEQTRLEVQKMIDGARAKWTVPNKEHEISDRGEPELRLTDWTAERYAGAPKPTEWLVTGTLPLGVAGLLAALGGIGKSYLGLDLGIAIAAGVAGLERRKLILGGRVAAEGTAVILTAEDSFDTVHRRLDRIDPDGRRFRKPERLIVVPLSDCGGARPLVGNKGGTLVKTPFFDLLAKQLLAFEDLRLVIIDPLQAFVSADTNADPAAAQFLWSALSEIASLSGATVLVTHHMRKDGGFRIRSGDDAREAIRGTTALVDGGRFSYALWKADDTDAKTLCQDLNLVFEPGRIVHGALVKTNERGHFGVHTYVRQESGLLVQCETEPATKELPFEPKLTRDLARDILTEIQRRFDAGTPFSHAPNSGVRYIVLFLTRQKGLTRVAAQELVADWLNNGVLAIDVCSRKTKLQGLKVAKWV